MVFLIGVVRFETQLPTVAVLNGWKCSSYHGYQSTLLADDRCLAFLIGWSFVLSICGTGGGYVCLSQGYTSWVVPMPGRLLKLPQNEHRNTILWGTQRLLSAPHSICFATPPHRLPSEQAGAALHFNSTWLIAVISKDTNASDKSHWKENSVRLTTNWSDYLILVSFKREGLGWIGMAIFI